MKEQPTDHEDRAHFSDRVVPDQPAEASAREREWDERYSSAGAVWSGAPNEALVTEAAGLPPGRALDVGCGEGADAVWLALRGWTVTAVDVSGVALERAKRTAAAAGVTIELLHSPLLQAGLPAEGFNLVSVQYPALLRTAGGEAERALLATVAPGGVLLVVHHADFDANRAGAHGFDPNDYVSHENLLSCLDTGWNVEIAERRPRSPRAGGGSHHRDDLVLKARKQLI